MNNQEELSTLNEKVDTNNDLKTFIVDHVGTKLSPENDEVNLEMVIEVMAEEFPELVLCVAEENWVRGYQQALIDVDSGKKFVNEKLHKKQSK
tara:strand:+ start:299 stop:577 length:279 start_codon:yes stop_codon:yes gene_type:complete